MATKQAMQAVDRYYGVVPRPREADDASAWPRGGRPKPSNWRERPKGGYSRSACFSTHWAHYRMGSDAGGPVRLGDLTPEQELDWLDSLPDPRPAMGYPKVSSKPIRAKTPRPHGTNGVDYHVGPLPAKELEPVAGPRADMICPVCGSVMSAVTLACNNPRCGKPKQEAPSVAAPVVMPMASQDLRYTAAAEVLRELAASYGPRRAHKLLAMADFVEAHARRVA